MSGARGRLVSAFVAPAALDRGGSAAVLDDPCTSALHEASGVAPARAVALLCRPEDGPALGGAVALALGSGTVVVALFGARPATGRAPATPGARRLAGRLASRGHAARAGGRLVLVSLAGDAGEAGRIAGASGAPAVTVIARARDGATDAVLAAQDRVLVAAPAPLAGLAAGSVEALGVPAVTLDVPGANAAAARALAAAGAALLAPLREPVRAALC